MIRWGGSQLGIMATPPREIFCMSVVLIRGEDEVEEQDDDDDDVAVLLERP